MRRGILVAARPRSVHHVVHGPRSNSDSAGAGENRTRSRPWHTRRAFDPRHAMRYHPYVTDDIPRTSPNVTLAEGRVTRSDREAEAGHRGVVLWLTGLSGSGKSTIAGILEKRLHDTGHRTYRLDGDNLRHGLCRDLAFSEQDREENVRRAGEVARLFADAGNVAIAAFISPYRRDRDQIREASQPGDFVEIHVSATLEVCEQRDPKGLYRRARAGEIRNFTGIDAPYEAPSNPEIELDTSRVEPRHSAQTVLDYLREHGYLRREVP